MLVIHLRLRVFMTGAIATEEGEVVGLCVAGSAVVVPFAAVISRVDREEQSIVVEFCAVPGFGCVTIQTGR